MSKTLDELYNEFMASDKSKQSWGLTVGLRIKSLIAQAEKEARIKALNDSYSNCFRIIKDVNEKLFMYEVLMGKMDYDYQGKDVIERFKEYQELEPERVKFAEWLERQEAQLRGKDE